MLELQILAYFKIQVEIADILGLQASQYFIIKKQVQRINDSLFPIEAEGCLIHSK
jgi:hypothetical protein